MTMVMQMRMSGPPTLDISRELIPASWKAIVLGADETGNMNPCEQTSVGGMASRSGLILSCWASLMTMGTMMADVVTLDTIWVRTEPRTQMTMSKTHSFKPVSPVS